MKVCSKCGETKDESQFYRDAQKKDGLCPQCKTCRLGMVSQYNHSPEKVETRKRYFQTEKGLAADRAHHAVQYAMRTRVLVRPDRCQRCGAVGEVEAHHKNGYEQDHYLDIDWLCTTCHGKEA